MVLRINIFLLSYPGRRVTRTICIKSSRSYICRASSAFIVPGKILLINIYIYIYMLYFFINAFNRFTCTRIIFRFILMV